MIDALTNEINRSLAYVQMRLKGKLPRKAFGMSNAHTSFYSFGPSDEEYAQDTRILNEKNSAECGGEETYGGCSLLQRGSDEVQAKVPGTYGETVSHRYVVENARRPRKMMT